MVQTIYEYLDAYRKSGRLNIDCALDALDTKDLDFVKKTVITSNQMYIIDAFVFAHNDVSQFMRGYHTALMPFEDAVEWASRNAREYAYIVNLHIVPDESDHYKVKRYMLQCARQNVDNPKRRGESWSKRVARLAGEVDYKGTHGVAYLVEWLPFFCPEEFMAMSHIPDSVLVDCIVRFENLPEDYDSSLRIYPEVRFREITQFQFEQFITECLDDKSLVKQSKELSRAQHTFYAALKGESILCAAACSHSKDVSTLYFQSGVVDFLAVDLLPSVGGGYAKAQRKDLLWWIHENTKEVVALPVNLLKLEGRNELAHSWGYTKSVAIDLAKEGIHYLTNHLMVKPQ